MGALLVKMKKLAELLTLLLLSLTKASTIFTSIRFETNKDPERQRVH